MGNSYHNKTFSCLCPCFKKKNDSIAIPQQDITIIVTVEEQKKSSTSEIEFEKLNQKIEKKKRLEEDNDKLKNHLEELEKHSYIETLKSLQDTLESKNIKIKELKQRKDDLENKLKDSQLKPENFANNKISKNNFNHSSQSSGQINNESLKNKSDSIKNKDKFNPIQYIDKLEESIKTEKKNCSYIQIENSELAKEMRTLYIEHDQITKEYNLALKLLSEEKITSNHFYTKFESLNSEIIYQSELQALQNQKATLVYNLNELESLLLKSQKDLQKLINLQRNLILSIIIKITS
ncbi:hypothetical protein SteCoe_21878 [Stentor coeruleus]|uniref:Uncharacterized protein n=1 Tax=Stentor coeruleus TaxID=5963 RepID=A0A1R2BNC4_9CILI|nr:hypothetical protein SteCoe_21878 [Stentor coeruleus]